MCEAKKPKKKKKKKRLSTDNYVQQTIRPLPFPQRIVMDGVVGWNRLTAGTAVILSGSYSSQMRSAVSPENTSTGWFMLATQKWGCDRAFTL